MSSSNLSLHDVRFRKRSDVDCDIVVHGEAVGIVTRRPDIANPAGGFFYVVHLSDDFRGPRQVDDRSEVRFTIARMLIERDLVPSTSPPTHPAFTEQRYPST